MESARTILLLVQEGDIWRVQIIWPNGNVHYFGRFASEKEASEWTANHAWWAKNKLKPSELVVNSILLGFPLHTGARVFTFINTRTGLNNTVS